MVERDQRALLVRLLRQLGLEQEATPSDRLGFSRG
jgi:hypothetical protein